MLFKVKKLYPLCENHLFSRAYRKGRCDANKYVAVYALKNYEKTKNRAQPPTKLGITVNRKLGGAVKRSRVKRLIRQAYRECADNIQEGRIVVVSARSAIFYDNVKSDRVRDLLAESFSKLGLYNGQTFVGTDGRKPRNDKSGASKPKQNGKGGNGGKKPCGEKSRKPEA